MKTNLIALMLIISNLSFANKKFIVETDQTVSEILLIDSKTRTKNKLVALQSDNTNFEFEAANLEGLYLKTNQNIYLKIYSVEEKISSSWHKIEKGKEIELKTFFQGTIFQNVELNDFYIKSFITNPLTTQKSKIREFSNFFYTPNHSNFIKPENLIISWKSGLKIKNLQIIDNSNFTEIFKIENYNDTSFSLQKIDKNIRSLFNNSDDYSLILNYLDTINKQESMHKINFQFYPLYFLNQEEILYFLDKEMFSIQWHSISNQSTISIYDFKNELILTKETNNQNSLTFENIKELSNTLQKKKKYRIFIENQEYKIYKDFYFLQNVE